MENKLTIKELAPYLPYEIGVAKEGFATQYFRADTFSSVYDAIILHDFRPLLRPLSDLTSEIEHNGERFVPIVELNKIRRDFGFGDVTNDLAFEDYGEGAESWGYSLDLNEAILIYNKLSEWHFDHQGLIERGLALPITK